MKTVHIVRGLPGTGKTTFVQKRFNGILQLENDQCWVTADGKYEYGVGHKYPRERVANYMEDMLINAMLQEVNVAVSSVFCHLDSVANIVDLAKVYNYDFKIWLMSSENRRIFHNVHNVPKQAIKTMEDEFVYQLPWPQVIVGITMEDYTDDFDIKTPPRLGYDYHDIPAAEIT